MQHTYIIIERATGKAVMEFYSQELVARVSVGKYDVMTAYDYLCGLNEQIKRAV